VVIGHSAHGAALFGVLAESHKRDHEDDSDDRRRNIQIVDEETSAEHIIGCFVNREVHTLRQTGRFGQAKIQCLDFRVPHQVGKPFKEIGQTDGCHEQDDRLLPHQVAENETLDRPGQQDHHPDGEDQREDRMDMPAKMVNMRAQNSIDKMRKRYLSVLNTNKGHRSKKSHHTLGKVKDA